MGDLLNRVSTAAPRLGELVVDATTGEVFRGGATAVKGGVPLGYASATKAVESLLRLEPPTASKIWLKRSLYDFAITGSSPAAFAAFYSVAVPTSTADEYVLVEFGQLRGCTTWNIASILMMQPFTRAAAGTETGSWAATDVWIPTSGAKPTFRQSTAAAAKKTFTVTGTKIAMQFAAKSNGGVCKVTIDGDAKRATLLPAATAATSGTLGINAGERYYQCRDSDFARYEWVVIADDLPNTAHTIVCEQVNSTANDRTFMSDTAAAAFTAGGDLATCEWVPVAPLCGRSGLPASFSAFAGVMAVEADCTANEYLGDVHNYHTTDGGHSTEKDGGTFTMVLDGAAQTLDRGDIVSGYDLVITSTADMQEYTSGAVADVMTRVVTYYFGARAGGATLKGVLKHTMLGNWTINSSYAAVLPFYSPYVPPGDNTTLAVTPVFVSPAVTANVPADGSYVGRYAPVPWSAALIGDYTLTLTLGTMSGSPQAFSNVGSGTGQGVFHACQGRTADPGRPNGKGKIYVGAVLNQTYSASSGDVTQYEWTYHIGRNPNAATVRGLLGIA